MGSLIGSILILIGVILLSARRDYEGEVERRFLARDSLKAHNEEAHYYAGKAFVQRYHYKPNQEELKKFIRKQHERGWLHDLIDSFR